MTTEGNQIELLQNGDEIFPAMLEAIRSSTASICFETYVYWCGDIAEEFAEALAERAKNGVAVKVLIDWYGSVRMDDKLIDRMEAAGVSVDRFRPLKWFNFRRANHRTHRKLLICDGKQAFTGGVGIAEEWTGNAQDPEHWRDNHYRITGPVVAGIQKEFFRNWKRDGHSVPSENEADFFPQLEPLDDGLDAELVSASPLNDSEKIRHLFNRAVEESEKNLDIATAYFVPGEGLVRKLIAAAERGVTVRLLICGEHVDEKLVRFASRACWGRLLSAGVKIYEYQKTLYHVKLINVDRRWATIGSANFDVRSCKLNDELNLVTHDKGFCREHRELFDKDLTEAGEVTLEQWEHRPIQQKILDRLALIFRSQL